jgi:hypothetical protein
MGNTVRTILLPPSAQIADFIEVDGSLWIYAPNKGAPVIWAVLFAVSMGLHIWQCM